MEKDEKDRICERVLKFLGFIWQDKNLVKDNYYVWGSDEVCFDYIENIDMLVRFIRTSKWFFAMSKDARVIDKIENPFWRCSIEEMAIRLDLIA